MSAASRSHSSRKRRSSAPRSSMSSPAPHNKRQGRASRQASRGGQHRHTGHCQQLRRLQHESERQAGGCRDSGQQQGAAPCKGAAAAAAAALLPHQHCCCSAAAPALLHQHCFCCAAQHSTSTHCLPPGTRGC
jgi:hypothetical protein